VSAAPDGDPHVLLQWQKHQLAHFDFWIMPSSQVEKNVITKYSVV